MKKRDLILLAIGMFILIAGCLQSCVTVEKKIRKAQGVAYQYPERFADFCAKAYPVVPQYIKGKDSVIEKTITVKGDSIPCPPNEKGEVVRVKCPDAKIVYNDRWRVDTVVKENTAKLEALKQSKSEVDNELAETKKKLAEVTESRKNWRLFGWIVLGSVAIVILFRIYRLIKP